MSLNIEELTETTPDVFRSGDLQSAEQILTLARLPLGARLILRCRADWRDATIVNVSVDQVTLSVHSPRTGRTYRVRRPSETVLFLDGSIPVLGEGSWRINFAHYDLRW